MCKGEGTVEVSGDTVTRFDRYLPYITSITVDWDSSVPEFVANVSVKNPAPDSMTSRVQVVADLDRQKPYDVYDFSGYQVLQANGGTSVFSVRLAPNASGTYYFYAFVEVRDSGSPVGYDTPTDQILPWGTSRATN